KRAPVAQYRIWITLVAGCQHHDWKLFIDQRIRSVFQFACGIAFRMGIRDFFELERSLTGYGVMYASSEVQEFFSPKVLARELLRQFVPDPEIAFNGLRKPQETLQVRARNFSGHPPAFSSQEQGHQIENRDLSGEALGCRHSEFRARPGDQRRAGHMLNGSFSHFGQRDVAY